MFSVSILLLALVQSNLDAQSPPIRATTVKSLDAFGACFTQAQEQVAQPWAFLPSDGGGTFTNAGATGTVGPYWLRIAEAKPLNHLQLFVEPDSKNLDSLVGAVDRCR